VPRSDLQVLPGDGPTVGAPLGAYRDVDMVSFTGATGTGRWFLKDAAQSILKKVVLECGHKTPAVVLKDAANLDHVGEHVVEGAFWRAGRNCSVMSCLLMMHKNVKAPCLMMSRPSSRSNV
jgi:gamma-glutamyl-gamma-aminobutyraldehyde dehydrogenase